AVDGDSVLTHPAPLAAAPALENLALFLAQFTPSQTEALTPLEHYAPAPAIDAAALDLAVRRHRDNRWRDYAGKLLRNCTEIRCLERWNGFQALRRDCDDEPLRGLLADPDRYIAEAELLKDGNSSTVALVRLPGRNVVVKRYNIKNWRHRLSRCWRPSRARHSWINAHRLRFLGIATPQPIAFLERRFGPWRGTAYYVAEHVSGDPLGAKLTHKAQPKIAEPVARLIGQLFRAQLLHGDMKASNILCHHGRPYVLDLDAMTWIANQDRFLRAYGNDRQRFLANWPDNSPVRQWFDANLPRAEQP
ncbi:lipopolysaccharide kinase InaA family protein, partial [Methylogaea oryzae]